MSTLLSAQKPVEIPLWPNGAPNTNGITTDEQEPEKNRISNVTVPTLTIYPATQPNGLAIIMCPGGGYTRLAMDHEGHDMAQWFNTQGITYAVLKYRMPNGHSDIPLSDAHQAIRLMREHAKEWNFSPAIPYGTSEEVIDELFASNEIYDGDHTVEGAVEYIKRLHEEYKEVYFCTVGKNINNSQKLKMLKRLIPDVKVITISFPNEVYSDKSLINMENSIFIDDHSKNLESSNAKYKILFEPYGLKNWNVGYDGLKIKSWKEVYEFIRTVHIIEEKVLGEYLNSIKCEENQCEAKDILANLLKICKNIFIRTKM